MRSQLSPYSASLDRTRSRLSPAPHPAPGSLRAHTELCIRELAARTLPRRAPTIPASAYSGPPRPPATPPPTSAPFPPVQSPPISRPCPEPVHWVLRLF